jgi:hypothetical protein
MTRQRLRENAEALLIFILAEFVILGIGIGGTLLIIRLLK